MTQRFLETTKKQKLTVYASAVVRIFEFFPCIKSCDMCVFISLPSRRLFNLRPSRCARIHSPSVCFTVCLVPTTYPAIPHGAFQRLLRGNVRGGGRPTRSNLRFSGVQLPVANRLEGSTTFTNFTFYRCRRLSNLWSSSAGYNRRAPAD